MGTQGPKLAAVVERLNRVERENRRLKRLGAVFMVGFAAVVLMGQALPSGRTVEAEQFILRDGKGQQRGALKMGQFGPSLDLLDQTGMLRVTLEMGIMPSLKFLDEKGKKRLELTGSLRPVGGKEMEGQGLTLFDGDERPKAALISSFGRTALNVFGKANGLLGLMADSTPGGADLHLDLRGENGKLRAQVNEDSFGLRNKDEKLLGSFAAMGNRAGIVLMEDTGRTIWSAP